MDWANLIQHYGYIAVLIGTFFEGETVLILGSYAVQQHILNFWLLVATAMLGSFIGDQLYYQLGRRYGMDCLKKRPKLADKFQRATQFIDKYPVLMILLMRFAWGLRAVLPISFGIKKYSCVRYCFVNIIACFIWAFVVVSVGLQVSHGLHHLWQMILPQHHHVVVAVIGCILIATMSIFIVLHMHKNKIRSL